MFFQLTARTEERDALLYAFFKKLVTVANDKWNIGHNTKNGTLEETS